MHSFFITGGTGTLGRALVRRILIANENAKIIIYSRNEYNQALMKRSYSEDVNSGRLCFILGDILDKDRLKKSLPKKINYVIHAAAIKRIEIAEENTAYAYATNITGSQNLLEASINKDINRIVLISSDKAVEPTTLYGATKMIAERLFFEYSKIIPSSVVRYGNVIGSRGSIIEYFDQCIRKNLPIPITDIGMTRFFLPMDHALNLIFQALDYPGSHRLFLPLIKAFNIKDLVSAYHNVENFNNELLVNTHYSIIGKFPHEKLHEKMTSEDDFLLQKTYYDSNKYYCQLNGIDSYFLHDPITNSGFSHIYESSTWKHRYSIAELRQIIEQYKGI